MKALRRTPTAKGRSIDVNEACPLDDSEPIGDEELQKAIAHLHSSMGHPDPQAMARAVRLTGGSARAVAACLRYRCSVCSRLKEPKPTPRGKISSFTELNQCVAVDLFSLADINGTARSFINCVDKASGYQIVAPVLSKHQRVVFSAFLTCWLQWAGVPEAVLTDMGG